MDSIPSKPDGPEILGLIAELLTKLQALNEALCKLPTPDRSLPCHEYLKASPGQSRLKYMAVVLAVKALQAKLLQHFAAPSPQAQVRIHPTISAALESHNLIDPDLIDPDLTPTNSLPGRLMAHVEVQYPEFEYNFNQPPASAEHDEWSTGSLWMRWALLRPSFNSVEMEAEYQSQRLGHETREDYVNRLRGEWSLMSNYFGGDE